MSSARRTSAGKAAKSKPMDKDRVAAWAEKHGIELPTAEKVLWLTRLLKGVMQSDLGNEFALMGGSAIVFLYRDMYRLSTDLDFDFVGNRNLGKLGQHEVDTRMDRDRETFTNIAAGLGMKLEPRGKRQARFVQYQASYPSLYRRSDVVELDISYRYGHSVLGTVHHSWPITEAEDDSSWKVNTLRQEELYAGKTLAMFDMKERLDFPGQIGLFTKRKIRHLFDVYLLAQDVLAKQSKVKTKVFRNLFVLFGMTRVRNFEYFRGNAIGSYTDADVDAELLPVMPRDYPVPTVDEMKWTVRKFLDQKVLRYTDREYRFMEDFRGRRFRPEDLFSNGDIAPRLRDTHYYREILGMVAPLDRRTTNRDTDRDTMSRSNLKK